MCDEASRPAASTSLSFFEMLRIRVSDPEKTETVFIPDHIAVAGCNIIHAKPELKSAQAERVQAFRVRFSVAASFPKKSLSTAHSFSPSLAPSPLFPSAFESQHLSTCSRRAVRSPVAEESTGDNDDAQLNQIAVGSFADEADRRPALKKKQKTYGRKQK